MASLTVAANETGIWEQTLVASTVDTITFANDLDDVEIINEGTVGLYVTVNGTTPTVGGKASYYVPPGMVRSILRGMAGESTVVKVISSGTPKYGVSRVA